MRIAIILSKCHRFGSSKYVVETTKYFAKKSHETHIFANTCDSLDNSKIFFHHVPTISRNFLIREGVLDIVHTINMKRYNNFFDITLSQPTRYFSPMIGELQFVYREWVKYQIKNKLSDTLSFRTTPLIERYNVKKAKKLIAISQSVKNEILSNYPSTPKEKIHVVYSGVNLEEFNPKNKKHCFNEIREKHNIPLDDILLIFVGNPFLRKGLDFVIKAFKKLKHEKLTLLISGRDDPKPYQILANKLEVSEKIRFNIGLTPEIYKYFLASDIFVFPTLYEPFGLVILEAMASGLPVITSKLAGAAELIDDGEDGLQIKNPKNSNEIAEKLDYLIQNDDVRKLMGKKARKKAELYSWEETAKGMLEVFEEVKKRNE